MLYAPITMLQSETFAGQTTQESRVDEAVELQRLVFRHTLSTPEWSQLQLSMPRLKALFGIACNGSLTIGGLARQLGVSLPPPRTPGEAPVGHRYAPRREEVRGRAGPPARVAPAGPAPGTPPPPPPPVEVPPSGGGRMARRTRTIAIAAIALLALLVGVAFLYSYLTTARQFVSTDNANIDGDQIVIAAPATGTLLSWGGQLGSSFHAGDVVGVLRLGNGSGVAPVLSIRAPHDGVVAAA